MTIDEIREMYLIEVGKAEGKVEGLAEGKAETVREMLKDEEPIEKIMKYTKLSYDEVLEIKKQLSKM